MIQRRCFLARSAALLAAPLATCAQAQSAASLPADLANQLEAHARKAPTAGAAVAVARGGTLLGSWTYGFASLAFETPVRDDTLFACASVGKHVTALGILKLVDQGRVTLDASVSAYLPNVPAAWADRSIRSLLNHTSGIPDHSLAPFKPSLTEDDPSREEFLKRALYREPLFAPGQGWSYCNTNYVLLGWIVEDMMGAPLAEALRQNVLRGLPTARYDGPGVVTPRLAEPYQYYQRYWRVPEAQTDQASGAGGVQLSVRDIAPWGQALSQDRVASRQAMRQALEWATLGSGQRLPYGFGWFLDEVRGEPVQWHTGGAPGHTAVLLRHGAEDLTVAVMMNTDPPSRFLRTMAWTAARAFAPQATYLDLPPLRRDRVDQRLADLIGAGGPLKPSPGVFSEDFARVLADPVEQRRFAIGFKTDAQATPIEEYKVERGRMRRYQIEDADKTDWRLVGFDDQDRIFWIWGC
ncbi:serine hydrolase [Caulobacter segnis]|uniref:serine hydrolase domain-containing protein n=1 Tax=Caulobacter segnis TaxID=88688 RepID=UPI00241064F5|nr:serine hydrolase domain-containing protein [Caulobacter segnis]MDG2523628.1 serine hydrolase [Caulobacter segnis]